MLRLEKYPVRAFICGGDGAKINFNRSSHTHEEREEGYEKIAHIHEFADTVEDTICNFGENIKMKSDD